MAIWNLAIESRWVPGPRLTVQGTRFERGLVRLELVKNGALGELFFH